MNTNNKIEELKSIQESLSAISERVNENLRQEEERDVHPLTLENMSSTIGLEKHIRTILEKCGSSKNEELHSVMRSYLGFINEAENLRPRDERVYKGFMKAIEGFRYMKPVNEAYESIRNAVEKDKVGVESIALLDEIKNDPVVSYIYDSVERPVMLYILERTEATKNNLLRSLRDLAGRFPVVSRLIYLVKEGRLPEEKNEGEATISGDDSLERDVPISPVYISPNGTPVFIYAGAFFAKTNTALRAITREEYEAIPEELRRLARLDQEGRVSYEEGSDGEVRVEYQSTSGSSFVVIANAKAGVEVLFNEQRFALGELSTFEMFSVNTQITDYTVFNDVVNTLVKFVDGTYPMSELDFGLEYSKVGTYGKSIFLANVNGLYSVITYDYRSLDGTQLFVGVKPSGVPAIFSEFFGKAYVSLNESTKKTDKKRREAIQKKRDEFEAKISKLISQRMKLKNYIEEGAGADEPKAKTMIGKLNKELNKLKREYEAFQEETEDMVDPEQNRYKEDENGALFYDVTILDKGVTPEEVEQPLGNTAPMPSSEEEEQVPDNYLTMDDDEEDIPYTPVAEEEPTYEEPEGVFVEDSVDVLDIVVSKRDDEVNVTGVVKLHMSDGSSSYEPFQIFKMDHALDQDGGTICSFLGPNQTLNMLDSRMPQYIYDVIVKELVNDEVWNSLPDKVTPEVPAEPSPNTDYLSDTPVTTEVGSFTDAPQDPASFFESMNIVSISEDGKMEGTPEMAMPKSILEAEQVDLSQTEEENNEPIEFVFADFVDEIGDGDEFMLDGSGVLKDGAYKEVEYATVSDKDGNEITLFHVNDEESESYSVIYATDNAVLPEQIQDGEVPFVDILGMVSEGKLSTLGIGDIEDRKADPIAFLRASLDGKFIDGSDDSLEDLRDYEDRLDNDGDGETATNLDGDPYTDNLDDVMSVEDLDKYEARTATKKGVTYLSVNESAGVKSQTFVPHDEVIVDNKYMASVVADEQNYVLLSLYGTGVSERVDKKRVKLITRTEDLYEMAYSRQRIRERVTLENLVPCRLNYEAGTGIVLESKLVRFSEYVNAKDGDAVKVYDKNNITGEPSYASKEYIELGVTASDLLNSMDYMDGILVNKNTSQPIAPVSIDRGTITSPDSYVAIIVHTEREEDNHPLWVPQSEIVALPAPKYKA